MTGGSRSHACAAGQTRLAPAVRFLDRTVQSREDTRPVRSVSWQSSEGHVPASGMCCLLVTLSQGDCEGKGESVNLMTAVKSLKMIEKDQRR